MKVLRQADVECIVSKLTTEEVLACSRRALVASTRRRSTCPPRLSINNAHFTSLHMPSELDGTVCEKVVSVPRSGTGLPASIQVFDERSGALKCLMNAAVLTAVRTAAASLLATRLVMKMDKAWRPRSLCVFGTGEQAFHHARLHLAGVGSLSTVTVIARTKNAQFHKTMHRLQDWLARLKSREGIELHGVTSNVEQCVADADIICCCTPSTTPLVTSHMLNAGQRKRHINLIGSYKPVMHELDTDAMLAADLILTDSTEDCMREAGELIDAVEAGLNVQDLRELGSMLHEEDDDDDNDSLPLLRKDSLTVFKCVGMSVMDNAIAQVILNKAETLQLGMDMDDF